MNHDQMKAFLTESNRIESVTGVTNKEIEAAMTMIERAVLTVSDLSRYVQTTQPGAVIRVKRTMNVRVGDYVAPIGGPHILPALKKLLEWGEFAHRAGDGPYRVHRAYEQLHPFMDGNGRTGRLIWLWMKVRAGQYVPEWLFLQHWYYDTLRFDTNRDRFMYESPPES